MPPQFHFIRQKQRQQQQQVEELTVPIEHTNLSAPSGSWSIYSSRSNALKFRARFGFLTVNLTFRFYSAEWKERKAKVKVSKGIKQKEDGKKESKRNRRGTEERARNGDVKHPTGAEERQSQSKPNEPTWTQTSSINSPKSSLDLLSLPRPASTLTGQNQSKALNDLINSSPLLSSLTKTHRV